MKTSSKTFILLLILSGSILFSSAPGHAQTETGEMFEKALYMEEVKGELQQAMDLYQKILELNPSDRQVAAKSLVHMGMCYEKMGQQQAREIYSNVIAKYPQQTDEVAFAKNRLSYLNAHAANLQKLAEQHLKKGNELFSQWEYELAIEEYRKAMELNPNSLLASNAQYCIGQSWFRAGKHDVALETFQKLMEENPESNIAPVTELMIAQVEHAMRNDEKPNTIPYSADNNTLVSEQGITFRKYKIFVGKNDRITYNTGTLNMSPDGRFLVLENVVVPLNGNAPFDLTEIDALRAIYSPEMTKATFYADSAIWTVQVSPKTGKTIGEPKKIIDGAYRYQSGPSWMPDGKQLVFTRIDDEVYRDIYTINVDNRNIKPLVVSPEEEGHAVCSPLGDKIIYKRENDLWIAAANGDDPKMFIENGGYPHFSFNSKWLFHYNWENSHLYSFEKEKNYKFEVPDGVGNFVSFSPDDEKMFFYRPSYDFKWGMKILSASGGPSFEPSAETEIYEHQWAPDGERLMAQSVDENGNFLYKVISLTGGKPKPLEIKGNFNGMPFPFAVSPDMDEIMFFVEQENRRKNLYLIPFSIEHAKTTGPARLIFEDWTGGAINVNFSWSHDGEKIALNHEDEIWTVNLKNREKKKLTNNQVAENWLDWSPDGTTIKYYITKEHKRDLYIVSEDGGKPVLLDENMDASNWSPDGKEIAVISKGEIYLISAGDGEKLREVIDVNELNLENGSSPKFSPDGRYIVFSGNEKNDEYHIFFYKYDLKTGKIECLLEDSSNEEDKYELKWSPDSKWLSYISVEDVKVRPEGVLWEAGFEEVKEKLLIEN